MRATKFTVGLVICVLLDFSSPFIGGAFTFNADECFEGVRLERSHARAPIGIGTQLPWSAVSQAVRPAPPVPVVRPLVLNGWLVQLRGAASSASSGPPAPGEDH